MGFQISLVQLYNILREKLGDTEAEQLVDYVEKMVNSEITKQDMPTVSNEFAHTDLPDALYLVSSESNQKRLDKAIAELNSGRFYKHDLIEE